MDAKAAIVDPVLARRSVIVLAVTILGFVVHGFVHLEPATIAVAGAAVLMIWARLDPHESFEDVEWAGLMFFVGLFIVVGALLETGVISSLADQLAEWTGSDPLVTSIAMVWFAGIASGIVDNIPLAAAMVPIVHELSSVMDVQPLWWSLALGADLGGNLTVIGASANVILITLAEREGHKITFRQVPRAWGPGDPCDPGGRHTVRLGAVLSACLAVRLKPEPRKSGNSSTAPQRAGGYEARIV